MASPLRLPTPAASPPPTPPPVAGIIHSAVRCVHTKGEDTVSLTSREWPEVAARLAPDSERDGDDTSWQAGPAAYPGTIDPNGNAAPSHEGCYSLFCVFDGHNGRAAAAFCERHFAPAVHAGLPAGPPPLGALEGRCGCAECTSDGDDERALPPASPSACLWRAALQRALAAALTATHAVYAARGGRGGSTATAVLVAGRVVTAANVGDSAAFLDTGAARLFRITADHRVASRGFAASPDAARLAAAGARVTSLCPATGDGPAPDAATGLGPLRAWTACGAGGLANVRAVGDVSGLPSPLTTPAPSLVQALLPAEGGRVLIASDGVWDAVLDPRRAARAARPHGPPAAAEAVVAAVLRASATAGGVPRDDATVIVVDVLPPGVASFPEALGRRIKRSASRGAALAAAGMADGSVSFRSSPGGAGLLAAAAADEENAAPPPRPKWLAALFRRRTKAGAAAAPPRSPAPLPPLPPVGDSARGGADRSARGGVGGSGHLRPATTGSSGSSGHGKGVFFAELARTVRGGSAFFDGAPRGGGRPALLSRVDVAACLAGMAACDDGWSSDDGDCGASAGWLERDAALLAALRGWAAGHGGKGATPAAMVAAVLGTGRGTGSGGEG